MRVCPRCGFETDAAVCPHDGATTVTTSTAIATYPSGTVIDGRYRIESVLGIGGFGAVYKCTQLAMDQQIAVKILKNEHIKSEEHVKRFAREAQAASKLSHPNTIRIFDFGSHSDDALFLAMEFLEGETLAQRIDTKERLQAAQVVHIMTQICHSLTEAHINGIIHRDLKPENIMLLDVAGDASFVKVLDFGIAAKLADADGYDEKLTEIGMIMGTPTYMSPEQAHGKPLDARCDIYSLGVLMYEMLTGRVPFEGDQPMTVLVKHINDPAVPPRELVPEANIPRAMEKVVLRCLEKEPILRPQTCAELAEMLSKAMTHPDGGLTLGRAELDGDLGPRRAEKTQGYHVAGDLTEPIAEMTPPANDPFATQAVQPSRRVSGGYSSSRASKTPLWLGLGALALVGAAAVALVLLIPSQDGAKTPENQGNGAATTVTAGANTAAQLTEKERAAKRKQADEDRVRLVTTAAELAAKKAASATAERLDADLKKRRAAADAAAAGARAAANSAAKATANAAALTAARRQVEQQRRAAAKLNGSAVKAKAAAAAKATRDKEAARKKREAAKANRVKSDDFRLRP